VKPMRFLVLGGTKFVGFHIVEAALTGGHDVTLFNRRQTNAEAFPDLECRTGDRENDLSGLRAGEWDAVIDVNGYMPQHVRAAATLLKGRVGVYCFISTGSVYAERGAVDTDEDSALAEMDEPIGDTYTDKTYGPLKVLCEREVHDAFPDAALIIRPGIVAGPRDGSERFTYWVRRLTRGGRVLAPQRPDQPLQLVHARDQADFIIHELENTRAGVFNTVGPDEQATFSEMIAACAQAAGTTPDVMWAPDAVLREQGVFLQLAMPSSGRWDGAFRRSNKRATAEGFRNRGLVELAADTLEWDRSRDQATTMQGQLTAEREAELLSLL
jgi:2'-hydroxyisoflavone reductase